MKSDKKQHILTVAEKLFNRFGINKTAVDEIARYANVAKGTIYNYFGNKDGIINEIIDKKISKFDDIIEKSINKTKDPFRKINIALTERIKILINNPFLSDKTLYYNETNLKQVLDELDKRAKKIINKILDSHINEKISKFEKKRIINTIFFTIRGIEESVKNKFEQISIEMIEMDIDYLIKVIFSKYNLAT